MRTTQERAVEIIRDLDNLRKKRTFWSQPATVHPFFRPDWPLHFFGKSTTGEATIKYAAGGDRTKHCTTLGAAVEEMVEALG